MDNPGDWLEAHTQGLQRLQIAGAILGVAVLCFAGSCLGGMAVNAAAWLLWALS